MCYHKVFLYARRCFFQKGIEGSEQYQAQYHIADTMGKIKTKAGDPVGKCCSRSAGDQVGQGAERAKKQTEETGNDAPEQNGAVVSQRKTDRGKDRPDIEIIKKPHTKAVQRSFQKNKAVDHQKNLFSEEYGIEDDEQTDDLDIRQNCHKDLSHEKQSSQKAHQCQRIDFLLCHQ